jgi:hypothetical protein
MEWDVFISHAWEDKESFARPLAKALEAKGVRVWFDEFTLTVGDRLRRSIDYGLANSRYGIVVLSPHFFAKEWPQKELDGLVERESGGEKVILPVWHNITAEQVRKCSLILADRIGVSTGRGLEQVVAELLQAMRWTGRAVEHPDTRGFTPGAEPTDERQITVRERDSLQRQLAELRENLRLIEERMAQYVLETDIPLQLGKNKRQTEARIADLERRLGLSSGP